MRIFFIILLAVTISIPALADVSLILDSVGYYPEDYKPQIRTAGYIPAPATLRVEILTTPSGGGDPCAVRIFDVNLPYTGDDTGNWGLPLLYAIKEDPNFYCPYEVSPGDWPVHKNWAHLVIYAAPGKRVALRLISTANKPLPEYPTMPPLDSNSANWPPAPDQKFPLDYGRTRNYDYEKPDVPLGILWTHKVARPPDWEGPAALSNSTGSIELHMPGIPTVSQWGLIVMAVLLLTAGVVVIMRRRRVAA